MSETDPNRVTCPGCSKSYRWDFKLVGRTVECRKCSVRFEVPDTPGTPGRHLAPVVADDGTYALDLDEEADRPDAGLAVPAVGGKCPACNNSIKDGAVICLNCGFNLKQGKRMETAVVAEVDASPAPSAGATAAPTSVAAVAHANTAQRVASSEALRDDNAAALARQHQFTEIYLPIILIGVGLLLTLLSAFVLAPANPNYGIDAFSGQSASRTHIALRVLIEFGIRAIIIAFPLMVGGIFFMAAVYGSSFGNFFTAILKLAGMAFSIIALNEALVHLLDIVTGGFGFIGFLIRFAIVIPAYAIECKVLFDMEEHETWTLFAILIVGPMVIGMLLLILFAGFIF